MPTVTSAFHCICRSRPQKVRHELPLGSETHVTCVQNWQNYSYITGLYSENHFVSFTTNVTFSLLVGWQKFGHKMSLNTAETCHKALYFRKYLWMLNKSADCVLLFSPLKQYWDSHTTFEGRSSFAEVGQVILSTASDSLYILRAVQATAFFQQMRQICSTQRSALWHYGGVWKCIGRTGRWKRKSARLFKRMAK